MPRHIQQRVKRTRKGDHQRRRATDRDAQTVAEAAARIPQNSLRDIAIERLKWQNRRWMAWAAELALFGQMLWIMHMVWYGEDSTARVVQTTDLLSWEMGFLVTIVVTYMGGSAVSTILRKKGE